MLNMVSIVGIQSWNLEAAVFVKGWQEQAAAAVPELENSAHVGRVL